MSSLKDELLIELGRLTVQRDAQAEIVARSRGVLETMTKDLEDLKSGIVKIVYGYYSSAKLPPRECALAVQDWIGHAAERFDAYDAQIKEMWRLDAEISALKEKVLKEQLHEPKTVPQSVPDGMQPLPDYLMRRPTGFCDVCGRKTWDKRAACGFLQPDGSRCEGLIRSIPV